MLPHALLRALIIGTSSYIMMGTACAIMIGIISYDMDKQSAAKLELPKALLAVMSIRMWQIRNGFCLLALMIEQNRQIVEPFRLTMISQSGMVLIARAL